MIPSEPPIESLPKWMRKRVRPILDWATAQQAVPGVGLSATEDPNGRILSISGNTAHLVHPWRVTLANIDGPYLTIERDSWLMASERWDDTVEIGGVGLGVPFSVATGDKIWLEYNTEDFTAEIKRGQTWEGFPSPIGDEVVYQLLAYLDDFPDEPLRRGLLVPFSGGRTQLLVQCTYSHLIAREHCIPITGANGVTLDPWHAPYAPN